MPPTPPAGRSAPKGSPSRHLFQAGGGCSEAIDIALERSATPAGPYHEEPDTLHHLQHSADGTAATAYFTDPGERGYRRARAGLGTLVAYSPNAVGC